MSGDAFQREYEKPDVQIAKYDDRIFKTQAQIRKLEIKASDENVFVKRFSMQAGLQELTWAVVEELIKEIQIHADEQIEIVLNFTEECVKAVTLI